MNRPHHLRAIPPDDPEFDDLCNGRPDADFINRHIEDTLYMKKAHSVEHLLTALGPGWGSR